MRGPPNPSVGVWLRGIRVGTTDSGRWVCLSVCVVWDARVVLKFSMGGLLWGKSDLSGLLIDSGQCLEAPAGRVSGRVPILGI